MPATPVIAQRLGVRLEELLIAQPDTGEQALEIVGAHGLAQLVADLDGLTTDASPWEFLTTYLLDCTDLLAVLAARDAVADRMRAIAVWQFLNFIRERRPTGSGLPIQRTLDRVRQLVLLAMEARAALCEGKIMVSLNKVLLIGQVTPEGGEVRLYRQPHPRSHLDHRGGRTRRAGGPIQDVHLVCRLRESGGSH